MGKRYSAIIALLFLVLAAHGAAAQTSNVYAPGTPQQDLCDKASAGGFTGCAIDAAALQAWLSHQYLSTGFLAAAGKGSKGQTPYIAALRQLYLLQVCEKGRPYKGDSPEDCARVPQDLQTENEAIVKVLQTFGTLNDQMKVQVTAWCSPVTPRLSVSIAEGDSFAGNVQNAHAVFSAYLTGLCAKLMPAGQPPFTESAFASAFPPSQRWENADVNAAQQLAKNLIGQLIMYLTTCKPGVACEDSRNPGLTKYLPDPQTYEYLVVSEDGEWLDWKDVVDYGPDPAPTGKIRCTSRSDCPEKKAAWLMEQWSTGQTFRIVESPPGSSSQAKWSSDGPHAGGARDNLALRAFGQNDPFDTGSSFNVTPQKASSTANSFNISAQAVVGWTLLQSPNFGADGQAPSQEPMALTPLIDVYYGPDKNSSSSTINRFGAGLAMAFRMDPLRPLSFLADGLKWLDRRLDPQADFDENSHFGEGVLQIIPEYITDSNFESKSFYTEVRYDLIDYPWFNCLSFGAKLSDLLDVNVTCGAAFIGDTLHSFKISTLQSNLRGEFGRIGGQVGFTLSPPDLPCRWEFLCNYVTEKLTAKTWYKVLSDESGNHGTIHNWTSSISYQYAPGVAFTASYTNGLEDITLLRLPTWKAGISASF